MFQRFYPKTKLAEEFVMAVRKKTDAVTAADLQQAFIANMHNSDKEMLEYMETEFDLGARKADEESFAEIDRKLKRERKLLELKQQQKEAEEMKELKAALGMDKEETEEKESIPVESETDSTEINESG